MSIASQDLKIKEEKRKKIEPFKSDFRIYSLFCSKVPLLEVSLIFY